MPSPVQDYRGTRAIIGLVPALYDRVDIAYPDANTEIYTFYMEYGLPNQCIVGVVTLVYSGDNLVSAQRTA